MSTRQRNLVQKLLFILMMVIGALVVTQSITLAQVSFPRRPVTVWIGFAPGGTSDIVIRALVEGIEKGLGQKMVVMNKPGGGGAVCASLLAKAKPDGYTIAGFPDTPITRAPHLEDLDYDPFRDLSYIIRVGLWKNAFVVKGDSPFKKWEDVVDWAKKNPGQLVYGYAGAGTTPHLAMVKVAKKEGITFKGVPFSGAAPVVSALLGGHVMVAGTGTMGVQSHVEAKTLRVLLVFEKEGLDYAPDVPTFEKLHYDFEVPTSVIICGPKGIPDPVRGVLEKAFLERMKQETFKKAAKDQELLLTEPLTGQALVDYLKKNNLIFEQYIKEAGIYKGQKK